MYYHSFFIALGVYWFRMSYRLGRGLVLNQCLPVTTVIFRHFKNAGEKANEKQQWSSECALLALWFALFMFNFTAVTVSEETWTCCLNVPGKLLEKAEAHAVIVCPDRYISRRPQEVFDCGKYLLRDQIGSVHRTHCKLIRFSQSVSEAWSHPKCANRIKGYM